MIFMSRLVHIQQIHNLDIQLNYLLYQNRFKSYSRAKKMIPIKIRPVYTDQYHHSIRESISPAHYTATFSPNHKKSGKNVIKNYLNNSQKVAWTHMGRGKEVQDSNNNFNKRRNQGGVEMNKAARRKHGQEVCFKEEGIPTSNSIQEGNLGRERPQNGEPKYGDNKYYHEQMEEEMLPQYFEEMYRRKMATEESENDREPPHFNEEIWNTESSVQSQRQKPSNKLEETTKSHLRSECSHEEQRNSTSMNGNDMVSHQQYEEVQRVRQTGRQMEEIPGELAGQISSYAERLQYSQRKTKKDRKHLKKLLKFDKYPTQASQNQNEGRNSHPIDLNKQTQNKPSQMIAAKFRKPEPQLVFPSDLDHSDKQESYQSHEHNTSAAELPFDSPTIQKYQHYQFEADSPQSLNYQHSFNPSHVQMQMGQMGQQEIEKNHFFPETEKTSSKQENLNYSKDSSLHDEEQLADSEEERLAYSNHPRIFTMNRQKRQPGTYEINKIHELASLVPEHPEDGMQAGNIYIRQTYGELGELGEALLSKDTSLELGPFERNEELGRNGQQQGQQQRRGCLTESRRGAYGRQYLNKKQLESEKSHPKQTANLKSRKESKSKSQSQSQSRVNQSQQRPQQQSDTENHTPEDEPFKTGQLQHIWSFSNLVSESDSKGISSRRQVSEVVALNSSREELSSIHPESSYKKESCFHDCLNASQSSPAEEEEESITVPLGNISERNNAAMRQQSLKLQNGRKTVKEEEPLFDLIGDSDNLKEFSSLAIEPKSETGWNQHDLREELSRFLIENKIASGDNTPLDEGEPADQSGFSSTFHLDSHNLTQFDLEDELHLHNTNAKSHRESNSETHSIDVHAKGQSSDIKQNERNSENAQLPQLERPGKDNIQIDDEDEDKLQMGIIDQLQSNNNQNSSSSQLPTFSGDIAEYRHHFHPRKQAISRFAQNSTGSIDSRRHLTQGHQRQYESLSPSTKGTIEVGFLKREKERLQKNLGRFKTRMHKY